MRVQIPMDDVHGVQVGHAGGYVLGEGGAPLPGQRLARVVQQGPKSAARDELRDEVELLVLVEDADEPEHVVVVERAQYGDLCFFLRLGCL